MDLRSSLTLKNKSRILLAVNRKLIFVVLILTFLLSSPCLAGPVIKVGSPPPPLELPNLKGELISLDTLLAKKTIVLLFGTTWSKVCQDELIYLASLYEKYKNRELEIIAVSFDSQASKLEAFRDNNKIPYTLLIDKKHISLNEFRILIIPTIFVIDKFGYLRNIYVDFDENIQKLLDQEIDKLTSPIEKK